MAKPWVLGISAAFHSGAACLMRGDEIVVAVQEERLTRRKRERIWLSQPTLSIPYCLDAAGIRPRDLDLVVTCGIDTPFDSGMNDLAANPLLQVRENGIATLSIPHHLGHAVSAFATSGFAESTVLVVDGSGALASHLPENELAVATPIEGDAWKHAEHASLYFVSRELIEPLEKHLSNMLYLLSLGRSPGMPPFASLGHMFSSMALQMFGDYLEAGKVMGLAPYGRPTIPAAEFVEFGGGRFHFSDAVPKRFPHDERWPRHRGEYQDLAASGQRALEEALLALLAHARREHPSPRLCYAGGVALNSIANERITRESGYEAFHVIPAAEDGGTALGAAWYGVWRLGGRNRSRALRRDFLGRAYTREQVRAAVSAAPAVRTPASADLVASTVDLLCEGRIVGWFRGGSEFGPRALGHRSILCDPRLADGKDLLNRRVKHREAFRPFAPVILHEELAAWFEAAEHTPLMDFMLRICPFLPERRSQVPAVVHVDGTGRLQTLRRAADPALHALLRAFHARTGVPILLNTSFNVMGEPLVETPEDALWCLLYSGLDCCVLEDTLVTTREGYASVLELVPRVAGVPEPQRSLGESRAYRVPSPYGSFLHHAPVGAAPLLDRIDGRRSGWDLLASLAADGLPMAADELIRELGVLARFSIVRFDRMR